MSSSSIVRHDTVACGNEKLHRIIILPEQTPWARLAVLHGYGDHSGRYVAFMQWMAGHGVECHAIDFRGHGESTGKPGSVRRWQEYLDDLNALLGTEDLSAAGAAPLFILGHSHGGLVAAAGGIRHQLNTAGVILSAPYFELKMPVSVPRRILAAVTSHLAPGLQLKSGVGGPMLTRDPEMLAETRADPFNRGIATPRWFTTTRRTQKHVMQHASQFTLPLLMLIAGDDTIANPEASERFFQMCGSSDKTKKIYEDCRHELLRELGREAVYADVLEWMQQRKTPARD